MRAAPSASDRMLWRQKAEDLLWLASACFILYYGDFRSNFFSLLVNDCRIWRAPLHIGSACIISDIFILFDMAVRFQEKLDLIAAATAIQAATVVGLAAFIWLCIALWPIWTILTVPMLFTLFMALVVLVTYLLPYIDIKMDQESLHYLCITPTH